MMERLQHLEPSACAVHCSSVAEETERASSVGTNHDMHANDEFHVECTTDLIQDYAL